MTDERHRLDAIQLLRAIAVLMVVYLHTLLTAAQWPHHPQPLQLQFFHLADVGAAGVDIFFVISGFIITVVAARYTAPKKPWLFLKKRFTRVIPLYWLVSLISIGLFFLHGKTFPRAAIVKTIAFFPFFDNSFFDLPVLSRGWTLSFELLFYLVIALSIRLAGKRYAIITIAFFISCILVNYALLPARYTLIGFLGNAIMLEFLIGILAAYVYLSANKVNRRAANFLWMSGLACLLLSVFTSLGNLMHTPETWAGVASLQRSIIWGIPAFLLVTGITLKEKLGTFYVHPCWIAIGNASFSIYLTHAILIQSIYVRWDRWVLDRWIWPDAFAIFTLIASTMGGYLFFKFVEKPVLAFLSKPLGIVAHN